MTRPKSLLHLPYAQWPTADRLLWEKALSSDDPFTETVGAQLSRATLKDYLFAWGRLLGFLITHEPSALETPACERLTQVRVRRLVHEVAQTNAPRSVARTISALYGAARMMMPERDWTWLRIIPRLLHRAAPPHASRGPVVTSLQLLDLGQQLMDESNPVPGIPISRRDAILYRDGLIFALLAFIPLRHKNLAALEIGRHVVQEGDSWFVVVAPEETKTGTLIDCPVPEMLKPYLLTYLALVRPRMDPAPDCTALWLNSKGGPLSYCMIGEVIVRHSASRLGVRITPHDARDAAATTWAISEPSQIGVARDLLTHSDLRTTVKYYNRARGIEASRAYGRVIAGMRKKRNRCRSYIESPNLGFF